MGVSHCFREMGYLGEAAWPEGEKDKIQELGDHKVKEPRPGYIQLRKAERQPRESGRK